jgi:Mg2+ and Co2+ transporter CorA
VLRRHGSALLTLASFEPDGRVTWHGLWCEGNQVRVHGPALPRSLRSEDLGLPESSAALADLAEAAVRSYIERLERLAAELDSLESQPGGTPLPELARLNREVAAVRRHLGRASMLFAELAGPLGTVFPRLGEFLPDLRTGVAQNEELVNEVAQRARDIAALRTATEANRLAESANELGRVSNKIAALANTSNVRMLGVAYIALALGLVSAVVLIPNTAATILGMPSAAWVPGLWVDVALVLLAAVPIGLVFSRPWVRRMLRGWRDYEERSAEGVADIPEVSPSVAAKPPAAERLIR